MKKENVGYEKLFSLNCGEGQSKRGEKRKDKSGGKESGKPEQRLHSLLKGKKGKARFGIGRRRRDGRGTTKFQFFGRSVKEL